MTKHNNQIAQANLDPRVSARQLYWQGWRISDIARHLAIKPTVVYSWKNRDNWDGGTPMQRVASSAEVRLHFLINQPKKSDAEYKEMKNLFALMSGYPRKNGEVKQDLSDIGQAMPDTPAPWEHNPPTIDNPPKPPRERREKVRDTRKKEHNTFSAEQVNRLIEIFNQQMFDYQRFWFNTRVRFRNLLKSRQIGATFYFSREALIDALKTGKNKVFLSASRRQAFQFKQYMIDMAEMVDVQLKGDAIRLHNGATMYFLGTNSRTAQSYHGDLYVDEYFWIPDFSELSRVAKPIASQRQYTKTYFSTPSATSHQAYPFWTGEQFNDGRPRDQHISIDVSHANLARGLACPDGQFRQIVTLDDAERGGCNLFDKDQLLLEHSPSEFRQLFMCEFIETGNNVFNFDDLQKCTVDSWDAWRDFYKPFATKPVGTLPVWLSYDPTESNDAAALVVILPPRFTGDKFRIIDRHLLRGNDFQQQADFIKKMMASFNVEKIVIDKTGLGAAVYQLVLSFFPMAVGVQYSLHEKYMMVQKMHALMRSNRVEWEIDNKDITAALLSIRTVETASGKNITYASGRSKDLSHSDVAWAALQAFYQEPLDGISTGRGIVEVC